MACTFDKGKTFLATPTWIGKLPSLHILNNKLPEPYHLYMHDYKHYERPVVVFHKEDHRPPKELTMPDLVKIFDFLKEFYL